MDTSRPSNRSSFAAKVKKPAISAATCLALLGGVECSTRSCNRINFLDNSRNIFVDRRFGESRGNLVNGEASSFGQTIWTDENGFRIDPAFKDPSAGREILFLGDSVGFGCGVEESETAVGRLRRATTDRRLYNASSIGYALKDYQNVAASFLPEHPRVKDVYVLMCLNDIYDLSALEIKKAMGKSPDDNGTDAASAAKRVGALQGVNDWLRSRSKFYLLVKNIASDTSLRVFQYDLQMYKDSDAYFEKNMDVLARMSERLGAQGIRFKVVLMPYEVQLRSRNAAYLEPQRMITEYLGKHGIAYLDTTEAFRVASRRSADLYLFGDAMHFSPAGHKVLFELLEKDLLQGKAAAAQSD